MDYGLYICFSIAGALILLILLSFVTKIKRKHECQQCHHKGHSNGSCYEKVEVRQLNCISCQHSCHKRESCPYQHMQKKQRTTYKEEKKIRYESRVVDTEYYEEEVPGVAEVELQKRQFEKDGIIVTEDVKITRIVSQNVRKSRPKYGQVPVEDIIKVPQIEHYTESTPCYCFPCQCGRCSPRMEYCNCGGCCCDWCTERGIFAIPQYTRWASLLLLVANGLASGIYALIIMRDDPGNPFFIASMVYFSIAALVVILAIGFGCICCVQEFPSCPGIFTVVCVTLAVISTIITLAVESAGYNTSYYEITNLISNDYDWASDYWYGYCGSSTPATVYVNQFGFCAEDVGAVSKANSYIVGVIVTQTFSVVMFCMWGCCHHIELERSCARAPRIVGFCTVVLNVICFPCAVLAVTTLRNHLVDDLNENYYLDLPGWSGEFINKSGLTSHCGPANGYTMFIVGAVFGGLGCLTSSVGWFMVRTVFGKKSGYTDY
mmetsp:Transcript_7654/g.10562  ORF Transcript_7654/g.10562 Transcript_7654/m.10562 type:complete len:490 (-) Transcript_7654:183-1652(-)